MSFADFGNDLYTGKRSVPVVARRRTFYLGSLALIVIALIGLGTRHLNLGLEFKGGSEFRVSKATDIANYETRARDSVVIGPIGHECQRDEDRDRYGPGADRAAQRHPERPGQDAPWPRSSRSPTTTSARPSSGRRGAHR